VKVLTADVRDPRREGVIEAPYMTVETDEQPRLMGKTIHRGRINAIQYGMFWMIESSLIDISEEDIVGLVNMDPQIDKLVPVEVHWPGGTGWYAMPVDRARRLLRKYGRKYVFLVSDVAARQGRLQWDLEHHPAMCMHKDPESQWVCGEDRIRDTVNLDGVQMPACRDHISAVRDTAKNLRLQKTRR